MTELKPCPFCGGEIVVTNYKHPSGTVAVYCGTCGAGIVRTDENAVDNALEAWNTRAEQTSDVEVLPSNYMGDEFVFCSDCKHYYVGERNGSNEWLCLRHQIADPGYGYCYWGERK